MLAMWRDASCVQRECGMRQCQGRGSYVRATLGALSQVAPGRLRQGTHMDPSCRRMLVGQRGLGTSDPWITCRWVCSVDSALPVSAYHTCCDRTRALQGCGAQRNDSSKGTYMCGGCGPRIGARGPGHTQRHWGACTLGGAREHGSVKPHRVSGPWGARGLGRAERYLDMLKPPSLPLLTLGVKRAGPVFLLGEGEGSQGRKLSPLANAQGH